jgi:hypothetical protein
MQQATYKVKMTKCNWNVIKSNNSHDVCGWKMTKKILVFVYVGFVFWWIERIKESMFLVWKCVLYVWGEW